MGEVYKAVSSLSMSIFLNRNFVKSYRNRLFLNFKLLEYEAVREDLKVLKSISKNDIFDKALECLDKIKIYRMKPNFYEVLSIGRTASSDDIEDARNKLLVGKNNKEKEKIEEAYTVLIAPCERSIYNLSLTTVSPFQGKSFGKVERRCPSKKIISVQQNRIGVSSKNREMIELLIR